MTEDRPIAPWLRGAAAAVLVFLQLPVLVVVLASFSASSYLTIPPRGLTLGWFAKVLSDPDYLAAIGYSLVLAILATFGSLVLGTAAAYALARRHVRGAEAVSALLMAPLVFPSVVIGVALLQYYTIIGLRGGLLGLVLAHVVITLPYVVRAGLAGLAGIDAALEDAAQILGANAWRAFRLVTLPLLRPALAAGGLFAFITSFDNVPVTIFLLGARQTTLPVKIFTAVEHGVDPSVAAISTLMIAATAIVLVAAERWAGFHRFV